MGIINSKYIKMAENTKQIERNTEDVKSGISVLDNKYSDKIPVKIINKKKYVSDITEKVDFNIPNYTYGIITDNTISLDSIGMSIMEVWSEYSQKLMCCKLDINEDFDDFNWNLIFIQKLNMFNVLISVYYYTPISKYVIEIKLLYGDSLLFNNIRNDIVRKIKSRNPRIEKLTLIAENASDFDYEKNYKSDYNEYLLSLEQYSDNLKNSYINDSTEIFQNLGYYMKIIPDEYLNKILDEKNINMIQIVDCLVKYVDEYLIQIKKNANPEMEYIPMFLLFSAYKNTFRKINNKIDGLVIRITELAEIIKTKKNHNPHEFYIVNHANITEYSIYL